MTHGSLFSGIGGFDLAAEWMGWDNIFHCEWNDFGKKVLNYYWPQSISYHDITKTDFTIHRGTIDVLTGGFPCQPYSTAGKRLGKEDERHLWPEMLRAIREIQPRWIVGENVLGLVSWNGGMVFEEVCAELEAEGYEVQPYVLPAAGVNAPHQRYRVWFVAYSRCLNKGCEKKSEWTPSDITRCSCDENTRISKDGDKCRFITNTNDNGIGNGLGQVQSQDGEVSEWDNDAKPSDSDSFNDATNNTVEGLEGAKWRSSKRKGFTIGSSGFEKFPTKSPICNGDDGLSERLDAITFPKWRNESIKAGGNAIVPQVAHQLFKAIQNYENQTKLF
jgi:DNA (cytosine-5)-methyltransferase 1